MILLFTVADPCGQLRWLDNALKEADSITEKVSQKKYGNILHMRRVFDFFGHRRVMYMHIRTKCSLAIN